MGRAQNFQRRVKKGTTSSKRAARREEETTPFVLAGNRKGGLREFLWEKRECLRGRVGGDFRKKWWTIKSNRKGWMG